jgi:hypothetical protein
MKIQLMSDLHFEFGWELYLEDKPDVTLILAGDIHSDPDMLEKFIHHACDKYAHVIMVAGNHEFYGHDYDEIMWGLGMLSDEIDNFHFLENDFIKLEDITFLGCTLWSEPNWGVFNRINDHHVIKYKGHRLLESNVAEMCRESKMFLKEGITKIEGKKVVITHFGPDQALMHPKWKNSPEMNTYFWALDGCRFVCNPKGYVRPYGGGQEHYLFNDNLILEI